jgi:hypothetical protein
MNTEKEYKGVIFGRKITFQGRESLIGLYKHSDGHLTIRWTSDIVHEEGDQVETRYSYYTFIDLGPDMDVELDDGIKLPKL